jgi:hypothetical protein
MLIRFLQRKAGGCRREKVRDTVEMMAFGDDARGDADMAEPLLLGESAAAEREQRVLAAALAETRRPDEEEKRGKDGDESDGFEFISERETLVFEGDRLFRGQGGANDAGGLFTAYFMSKIQPGSGASRSMG